MRQWTIIAPANSLLPIWPSTNMKNCRVICYEGSWCETLEHGHCLYRAPTKQWLKQTFLFERAEQRKEEELRGRSEASSHPVGGEGCMQTVTMTELSSTSNNKHCRRGEVCPSSQVSDSPEKKGCKYRCKVRQKYHGVRGDTNTDCLRSC